MEGKRDRELKVYDREGVELKGLDKEREIKGYWEGIFKKHSNKIGEIWNEEERRIHRENIDSVRNRGIELMRVNIDHRIREHIDGVMRVEEVGGKTVGIIERAVRIEGTIEGLPRIRDKYREIVTGSHRIEEEEVRKTLKKIKGKKAPGLDGLKSELYKELGNSKECVKGLAKGYNRILEEGGEPDSWGKSRAAMLGKNRRPRVEQIRLLTMTEVGYKIFMSILGDKIERHLEENGLNWENQAGFTKGGRVEDNLFILQQLVEKAYRNREQLVIVGIDFEKAYDSVKRDKLIEIMRDYRIQGEIIDFIGRIYTGDRTYIGLGGDRQIEIELESGIRQGCTASTILFKMVTYKIIEEINRKCRGVRIGGEMIRCLFFADDGLLVSDSVEEAGEKIKALEKVGGYYGLSIHKGKSKAIVFNKEQQPDRIEGIKVEKVFRYLGLEVENKKDLFKGQREKMVAETRKMGKIAYSVMGRACNRIEIGKTYWKNVVMPAVLYWGDLVV